MKRTTGVLIAAFGALAVPMAAEGQTKAVIDPDSVVSIEIPADWGEVDLGNQDASLTFGDPEEDAYFMVIVEEKADMFGWNLAKIAYVTGAQTIAAMDFPDVQPPTYLEVDGSEAVRWDLQGATSGTQVRFAKIAIDAPTAFIQLIGWTGLSAWDEKGRLVEGVLDSADLLP